MARITLPRFLKKSKFFKKYDPLSIDTTFWVITIGSIIGCVLCILVFFTIFKPGASDIRWILYTAPSILIVACYVLSWIGGISLMVMDNTDYPMPPPEKIYLLTKYESFGYAVIGPFVWLIFLGIVIAMVFGYPSER
jgi:hypothetical protein